jgi:ferredoxin-fold anticodon binding domain-containing protein
METNVAKALLRIFISSTDQIKQNLLSESMHYGCLVTIENVEVLLFKSGKSKIV